MSADIVLGIFHRYRRLLVNLLLLTILLWLQQIFFKERRFQFEMCKNNSITVPLQKHKVL